MTEEAKDLSMLFRVEGGSADDGRLDLHDASAMLLGLARAVNITAHAFANDNDLRTRANTAKGAQAFVHSSRKGCFEEQIDVVFDKRVVQANGHSVLARNFWDYMDYFWSAANGIEIVPTTPKLKKIIEGDQHLTAEMADALEVAMLEMQRPIARNDEMKIFVSRPRGPDALELNKETLRYVETREIPTKVEEFTGNVTKFNVLSNFGRMYSDAENRVISFRLADSVGNASKKLLLESMGALIDRTSHHLVFRARRVVNARDETKRYLVTSVEKR